MDANSSKPRRLGRGIGSLMQMPSVSVVASMAPVVIETQTRVDSVSAADGVKSNFLSDFVRVSLSVIQPSRFQPRRAFDQVQLQQLADSIRHSGLMQPIIIRPLERVVGDVKYELIAGERRWRAAAIAGLEQIPAMIRALSDEEAAEWGLVENIQREDLNPMDRAFALRGLLERFGFTQEQLATRIGLDRATIANLLRLCELEEEIATMLMNGKLTAGHGRALLSFPRGEARLQAAKLAMQFGWSVRKLEELGRELPRTAKETVTTTGSPRDAVLRDLERQLGQHLGTKVMITTSKKGSQGRVTIEYYGIDHFDGLMTKMGLRSS